MKKLNRNLSIGVCIFGITLLLNHIFNIPDFITGLCFGVAITFDLIGMYEINHDISKIKNYKINLFKKLSNK